MTISIREHQALAAGRWIRTTESSGWPAAAGGSRRRGG